MSNSRKGKTTVSKVMQCGEFKSGFDDYRAGRPMRDDWSGRERSHIGAQQWSYERGRMFAAWCKACGADGIVLKVGRRVTDEAAAMFADAYRDKAIL